jgi:hypothetical protein
MEYAAVAVFFSPQLSDVSIIESLWREPLLCEPLPCSRTAFNTT